MKIVGKTQVIVSFRCSGSVYTPWLVQGASQIWDAILPLAARSRRSVEAKWVISDCSLCQGQAQVGWHRWVYAQSSQTMDSFWIFLQDNCRQGHYLLVAGITAAQLLEIALVHSGTWFYGVMEHGC